MSTTDLPGVVAGPGWQPGDELYERHAYSQYLFNYRDDPTSETCRCGDAAVWPNDPLHNRRIEDDPFAEFIAWWRANEAGVSGSLVVWLACLLLMACVVVIAGLAR